MCRRTEEEVGPTVGLPRNRHFVGFFNVPVLEPTRDHHFYTVIPTPRPIWSPFTITLGIRRTHSRLNPQALMEVYLLRAHIYLQRPTEISESSIICGSFVYYRSINVSVRNSVPLTLRFSVLVQQPNLGCIFKG